ncbi:MAG: hypothetical protein U0795_21250 [Pirellulales bacterium]
MGRLACCGSSQEPCGNLAVESDNPYSVSESLLESIDGPINVHHLSGARVVRERNINTEVSIQQIGRLFWLGGLATIGAGSVVALVEMAALIDRGALRPNVDLMVIFIAAMFVLVGWLHIVVGRRLQDLNPRVRGLAITLALLQLMFVPLGTVVGLLLLILVWSPQGRYVFTDEYKSVRALTPGMRPRPHYGFWVLLLSVVGVVVIIGLFGILVG